MKRRRRGRDRAMRQAINVGRAVRLARQVAGLSIARGAAMAGVAPSTWRRVEHGAAGTTIATLCAMTETIGLDFVAQAYPGREPRLRDSGQLELAQVVASMASSAWTVSLEVPAGDHGEAIDQVLWGPEEIIAIEIERLIGDGQAQLRRAAIKRDRLASVHRRPVRLVVLIEDTRRNRAALAAHLPVLRAAFPAGSAEVFGPIRSGRPLGRDGLAWVRRPPAGGS